MSDSEALRERVDAVQRQATELKKAVDQVREEGSEQVKARIQQVKGDIAAHQEAARAKAAETADRAQSYWQSMTADAPAKMQDLQDGIGRQRDELDAKRADHHAEVAEYDAVDAVDFAWWAVEQAELAVLDAADARAWADERVAATRTR